MNAYESGQQKVIPAVLLYAFYENKVLMIRARGKDGMPSKWNGLGGKLEAGESPILAAVREFEEEANCKTLAKDWAWLGQLYFPNFKAHKSEDWWVTVYTLDLSPEQFKSIPLEDLGHPEGMLSMVEISKVNQLELWDGDLHFIPLVLARTPFEGTFFYEQGKCVRHELALVKASNQ